MNPDSDVALSLEDLSKVFQGQRALNDVDLEIRTGEVHALLGPNGSGKSTLIKILAGYHQPEPGARATLYGEPFELGSLAAGRKIRFIHQDLGLVPTLDGVDNLALGATYAGRWWLSDRRERRAARRLLADYGAEIDVTAPVQALSRAEQTVLAVVRACAGGLGPRSLVVLDEPTAALPAHDVERLFQLIRSIRGQGGSVIYVTHRLNEVLQIADRVTVLRDGVRVTTRPVAGLTHDDLVELIVGRPLDTFYPGPPTIQHDTIFEIEHLRGDLVADVSLAVRASEIVGITGLVGSGYEEVLGLVFGAHPRRGGEVRVNGRSCAPQPHRCIAAGLAYAPADRKKLGAIVGWMVQENVTLPGIPARGVARWLSTRREAADVQPYLDEVDVTPRRPDHLFSALSGGNQQKVVIARWLRKNAQVFLLEEPTNGVDMGAKHAIYEHLVRAARAGSAVVLTSQDPEELSFVCDRVVVLREGRIGTVLAGAELTEDRILEAVVTDRHHDVAEGALR